MLAGGERLEIGGPDAPVRYTPGHASHHVSYLDTPTAWPTWATPRHPRRAGLHARCRRRRRTSTSKLWEQSLTTIEAWNPAALVLTHFGTVADPRAHIARFREVLERLARWSAKRSPEAESDEERTAAFVDPMRADARGWLSEREAAALEPAAAFEQIWAWAGAVLAEAVRLNASSASARRCRGSHVLAALRIRKRSA